MLVHRVRAAMALSVDCVDCGANKHEECVDLGEFAHRDGSTHETCPVCGAEPNSRCKAASDSYVIHDARIRDTGGFPDKEPVPLMDGVPVTHEIFVDSGIYLLVNRWAKRVALSPPDALHPDLRRQYGKAMDRKRTFISVLEAEFHEELSALSGLYIPPSDNMDEVMQMKGTVGLQIRDPGLDGHPVVWAELRIQGAQVLVGEFQFGSDGQLLFAPLSSRSLPAKVDEPDQPAQSTSPAPPTPCPQKDASLFGEIRHLLFG